MALQIVIISIKGAGNISLATDIQLFNLILFYPHKKFNIVNLGM